MSTTPRLSAIVNKFYELFISYSSMFQVLLCEAREIYVMGISGRLNRGPEFEIQIKEPGKYTVWLNPKTCPKFYRIHHGSYHAKARYST